MTGPVDGHGPILGDELRDLVRQTLREALPSLLASGGAGAAGMAGGEPVEPVVIASDGDLARFVERVVQLADDPRTAQDLRAGRLRFRLLEHAPGPGAGSRAPAPVPTGMPLPPAPAPAEHRIEKGAVLEKHVRAAADAGARLVAGPRALVTPLARERARASGVEIVVEPRRT